MEIELKYVIPGKEVADSIWDDMLFKEYEEPDSREEICLDAKYFDTESYDLARNEIAYRVRKEDDRLVASLKWKGHSEDGLHVREEINVPVDCDEPNPEVFKESNVGSQVMEFIQGRELKCFLRTTIHRRRFRIDTGKGIYEFSVDTGEVITEYGAVPIEEVEIELFSGDTEELVEVGKKLQTKYNLVPDDESKYAKGIKRIKECR